MGLDLVMVTPAVVGEADVPAKIKSKTYSQDTDIHNYISILTISKVKTYSQNIGRYILFSKQFATGYRFRV